jgi:hypothetical protein
MRTVHSPPELTNGRQFRDKEDLTGYWIGGLQVYQAGGPPLGFEKTGLTLWGCAAVGEERGDAINKENLKSNTSLNSERSHARDIAGLTRH